MAERKKLEGGSPWASRIDLDQVCGPKWLCCKPSDDVYGQQPSSRANSKDYTHAFWSRTQTVGYETSLHLARSTTDLREAK